MINRLTDRLARRRRVNRARKLGFTIVASNCWGATVYQDLGLEYQTPFVGLFLHPDCYLKLIDDLSLISSPMRFVETSRYPDAEADRQSNNAYPVGVLADDIEVHFVHDSDPDDALAKWQRRSARVNPDRLFLAFTDRDGATEQHLQRFDAHPVDRKVCFTAQPHPHLSSVVPVPACAGKPCVDDLYANRRLVDACFDVPAWLNDDNPRRNKETAA